jgi:hypothetical protein
MESKRSIALSIVMVLAFAGCAFAVKAPAGSGALPSSASSLNWVRYTDSAEGAFSMEVPVGWQILGGMYRFGYFDVRWMMDVRSLDGKVIIRIDDPNVPPHVLPGPHTGSAGHPDFKPQMYQMMVDNYREAQPFAESYAKHRFAGACTSFTPRQSSWAPNLPASWQNEAGARVTQATVSYDCSTSDGARVVVVYARNTLHPGSGLWMADPLVSLIAAPDAVPLAQSMVQRMIDSWEENPQWKEYQQQVTNWGLQKIRENFGQFMQQMQAYHQQREAAMNQQVAHFEAGQNAQAEQVSGWGKMLTGLTTVADSQTGTQFDVFSGPKANYYTNGNGVTINSNLSPGPGFHEVTPVGP